MPGAKAESGSPTVGQWIKNKRLQNYIRGGLRKKKKEGKAGRILSTKKIKGRLQLGKRWHMRALIGRRWTIKEHEKRGESLGVWVARKK